MNQVGVMEAAKRESELVAEPERARDRQRFGEHRFEELARKVLEHHQRLGTVDDEPERARDPRDVERSEESVLLAESFGVNHVGLLTQALEEKHRRRIQRSPRPEEARSCGAS
jgi:hypothetical protein